MHTTTPVTIPSPTEIRALRISLGTQMKCANLAQIDIKTWQDYEHGRRSPNPRAWALFLLHIDQHPTHTLVAKGAA